MEAVLDSSSVISLARAGLLDLADTSKLEWVVLDRVWAEVVGAGRRSGHPDAAAIDARLGHLERRAAPAGGSVDAAVVGEAARVGVLVTNDLGLGRRARNLGALWLRTADLILLLHEAGEFDRDRARAAIVALREAGRISPALATRYLEELS